jgi:hypothetical protein
MAAKLFFHSVFRRSAFSWDIMAWRIEKEVSRGEIDNRIRGRITARLWFCGDEGTPMEIRLTGDAQPDLHGRFLTFTNPDAKPGRPDGLSLAQRGTAGHITASRKVKIPDVPLERLGDYYKTGKPLPCHWGNVLYFEWFSETNGRVVIEAPYVLRISTDAPTWELSPGEKAARDEAFAAAADDGPIVIIRNPDFAGAPEGGACEESREDAGADEDDERRPPTEEEADRTQAESDLLMDRIMARMRREGKDADFEKILDEEITRRCRERGEPEPTPEQLADNERRIDDLNAVAGEALDGMAAEAWKEPEEPRWHPLTMRARELALRVSEEVEKQNWCPDGVHGEHPVLQLVSSLMCVGPKLAGALGAPGDWPPPLMSAAATIVRLKKALDFIEDVRLAAECCAAQNLTGAAWLDGVMRETGEIAAAIEALIAELRARLKEGRK